MCVIIYVPNTSSIDEDEVKKAWNRNPDGAGFSIQKNNKVYFKRGFMNLEEYWNEIKKYIGKYNLLLHFRISTSNKVNKVQTHPYKKGNVMLTEGWTTKPVICMNGVISKQTTYKDCNDTMSFITDHQDAFANINQDILNIIEELTGSKWAVMKPNEILLSSKFKEENGRWYSNKNHLITTSYYTSYYYGGNKRKKEEKSIRDLIKNENLIRSIIKDKDLYYDLLDFVDFWCNGDMCWYCTKCLSSVKTLRDVKLVLEENYYNECSDPYDYKENSCCCSIDYDTFPQNDIDATYFVDGKIMNEEEYINYLEEIGFW